MKKSKVLLNEDNKLFLVRNLDQDYHCQYGQVKKECFIGKNGARVETNKGILMSVMDSSFLDLFSKIKRGAQIIPMKDMGSIIVRTGINKKSVVADAGTGSGALCCMMAQYAKKVYSYDVRDDHIKIGLHNKDLLGLSNLVIKKHDIYEGIPKKDVDVLTLDVPEPWFVIPHAEKSLKVGGMICGYCPTVPQVMDFVEGLHKSEKLIHVETVEIIERAWEVKGRKVRPFSRIIAHSGFLTFARKIYE